MEERETDGWIRVSAKQERLFQLTYGVPVPRPDAMRALVRQNPWMLPATPFLTAAGVYLTTTIATTLGGVAAAMSAVIHVVGPPRWVHEELRILSHGHLAIARAVKPRFGKRRIWMNASIKQGDIKRDVQVYCPDSPRLRDIVDKHGGADFLVLLNPKHYKFPMKKLDAIAFRIPDPDGHVSSGHAPAATLALGE